MTQHTIEELSWAVLPHAPYSLDFATFDYHLIRLMEQSLRNMQFTNIQRVRKWVGGFFSSKLTALDLKLLFKNICLKVVFRIGETQTKKL